MGNIFDYNYLDEMEYKEFGFYLYLKDALKKAEELRESNNRDYINLYIVALADEVIRLRKLVDKNKQEVSDSDDVGTPVNLDNIEPDRFTIPGSLSSSKVPTNETFDVIKQHIKALADLLPIDEKADDEADKMMREAREKVSLGVRKIDRNDKDYYYDGIVGKLRDQIELSKQPVEELIPCNATSSKRMTEIITSVSKRNNLENLRHYFEFDCYYHGGLKLKYENPENGSVSTLICFYNGEIKFISKRKNVISEWKIGKQDEIDPYYIEYLVDWFQEDK
jgi:hypothetical protein